MPEPQFYELYRRSSVGGTLTDTLDQFITDQRIEPQLAMKVLTNFDKAIAEVLAEKVKARLTFKGHLDTYRFCDEVWTFIIKDINFKLDNTNSVHADKIKIVSCSTKRPGLITPPDSEDEYPQKKAKYGKSGKCGITTNLKEIEKKLRESRRFL